MLDKQDCLQLLGFLPEQSKAKVQIISNQSDFRMILFSKTAKIHQKLSALTFASSAHHVFKKSCIFAIGFFQKKEGATTYQVWNNTECFPVVVR